jgi:predicted esterase
MIALTAGLAAGSTSASLSGPVPGDLRYAFPVGDVLTYEVVFDTKNSPLDYPDVTYTVREVWLIKVAVVDRSASDVGLAIQSNRIRLRIVGRSALARVLGEKAAANSLDLYERAGPVSVRYLRVDDLGRNLNHSYTLRQAASFVAGSMKSVFQLPSQPVGDAWRAAGDQPLDISYEGLKQEGGDSHFVFSAKHRAGWAIMGVDRDKAVPGRFEYAADYGAANEQRREHQISRLLGIQRDAWKSWYSDPRLDRALVLGAIARTGLACQSAIIKRFLDGKDGQEQELAAAYCALRGIPPGLDMKRYLYAANPVVRFNAAKALFRFAGDASHMVAKLRDRDSYVSRRATGFLATSTDQVPADREFLFWVLQTWLYGGSELPDALLEDPESLRDLLRFLKPANDYVGGCYRLLLPGETAESRHPYYVSLPLDYDPAETYPMLVYLGMGDGRGDYAFQAIYNGLGEARALSRFILVVPQADGKWWDKDVEPILGRVLTAVQKTFSVDADQVFLAGSSNGGMGTIYFGTRLPDRFAGLAVNMGYPVVDRSFLEKPQNLDLLRNLRTARVFLNHGASDDWVTPEGDRQVADILRQVSGPVVRQEMPNRKHDIEIREVIREILKTFESARRDPYPRRLDFTLADPAYARCFWLEAVGAAAGDSFNAVIEGNTIEIRTDTRGRFRLYLDEELVDMGREVLVRVNGREAFRGRVKPTVEDLVFTLAETLDAKALYGVRLEIDPRP